MANVLMDDREAGDQVDSPHQGTDFTAPIHLQLIDFNQVDPDTIDWSRVDPDTAWVQAINLMWNKRNSDRVALLLERGVPITRHAAMVLATGLRGLKVLPNGESIPFSLNLKFKGWPPAGTTERDLRVVMLVDHLMSRGATRAEAIERVSREGKPAMGVRTIEGILTSSRPLLDLIHRMMRGNLE